MADYEATRIAGILAYRLSRDYWPVLNLGLLLDHVEKVGESAYQHLILNGIGKSGFHARASIASQFCSYFGEHAQDLRSRVDTCMLGL